MGKIDNAIHASIRNSDKDIGIDDNEALEKTVEKDNAIHSSIHPRDKSIGMNWVKNILKGKKIRDTEEDGSSQ